MLSSHICDASCLDKARGLRTTSIIKCFGCDQNFNAKCFNGLSGLGKLSISSDSNLIFVCGKCHQLLSLHRISATRKSMNISNCSNSANSTRLSSSNNITNKATQPVSFDTELRKTFEVNTELLQTILSHVLGSSNNRHEPEPATAELTKSVETNSDLLRTTLSQVTQLSYQIETLQTSTKKNTNDSDAFDICRRFEKLNWESIDIINRKIDGMKDPDNSNHLDNIRSSLNDLHQKISNIESTIASMHETPMPLSNLDSHDYLANYTTQQLSDRFKAILSDDNDSSCLTNAPIPGQVNDSPHPTPQSNVVNLLETNNSLSSNDMPVHQPSKYEFYVTKFSTNTTTDMIRDYMRRNGVPNESSLKVSCLVPRNKDRSTLTFVSFKIDTQTSTVADMITGPRFWPNNCTIRSFNHKSVIDLSSRDNNHNSSNFFYHPGTNQKPT